jgi:transcription initiation factor IIE alpha subunit
MLTKDDPILGCLFLQQEVLDEFDDEADYKMDEIHEIVLDWIPFGKEQAISRKDLADGVGISDRELRRIISELRRNFVICNDQDGKGYYRTGDLDDIERAYRQERARALSVLYRLQPMRDILIGGGRL